MTPPTKNPLEQNRPKGGALRALLLLRLLRHGPVSRAEFRSELEELGALESVVDETVDTQFRRAKGLLDVVGYQVLEVRDQFKLDSVKGLPIERLRTLPLSDLDLIRLDVLSLFYESVVGFSPRISGAASLAKDALGYVVRFEYAGDLHEGTLQGVDLTTPTDGDRILIRTTRAAESFPVNSISNLQVTDVEDKERATSELPNVVHPVSLTNTQLQARRKWGRPRMVADFIELRRLDFVARRFEPLEEPFTVEALARESLLAGDRVESLATTLALLNSTELEYDESAKTFEWHDVPADIPPVEGMTGLHYFRCLERLKGLAGVVLEASELGGQHEVDVLVDALRAFLSGARLPDVETALPFRYAHELVRAQLCFNELGRTVELRVRVDGSAPEKSLAFAGLSYSEDSWWVAGTLDGHSLQQRSLSVREIISVETT